MTCGHDHEWFTAHDREVAAKALEGVTETQIMYGLWNAQATWRGRGEQPITAGAKRWMRHRARAILAAIQGEHP